VLQQPTLVTAWLPYISCLHEVDLDCHFRVTFLKKLVFEPLLSFPHRPFIRLSHTHDGDRIPTFLFTVSLPTTGLIVTWSSTFFLDSRAWNVCTIEYLSRQYRGLEIFSCCQPSSLIFLKLNLYWGGCGQKFGENNGYLTWNSHYSALWRLGKCPPGWISWVWVVYRMRISKIYIHVVNYYEKKPTGMNFLKVWKKSEWYIEWDSERRPRTYVFSYEINSLQRRTCRNLLRKKPNYWLNLNFSISRFYFLPLRLGRSRSYLRLTNPSSSFEVVRVVVYRASHSPISRQTRDIDV